MSNSRLTYRAEIDGLRAIAVLSVIFYHAKFSFLEREWFSGGYIGVDIFFVISGYLITRIILSELLHEGSFDLKRFYERRARRILPMLIVVIFFSTIFAWQRLLPIAFQNYAESIIASLIFVSNFLFYFNTTEYGAEDALLHPFLHTWSLSVEEQFYLIFPIFAIFTYKLIKKYFFAALIVLTILSFYIATVIQINNPQLNFFHPFSRFWELAIGSILAYRELAKKPVVKVFNQNFLPIFGLILILFSLFYFDSNTAHPSFPTLMPVLGVALIIAFTSSTNMIGRLLSVKLFVWTGLISYSAYLWHFPIFAFYRIGLPEQTNLDKAGLIIFTFLLSIISYFYIERVFRNKNIIPTIAFSVLCLLAIIGILISMNIVIGQDGFKYRLDRVFDQTAASYEDSLEVHEPLEDFKIVFSTSKPKIVILGDSYTSNWGRITQHLSSNYEVINLQYLGCEFQILNDVDVVFDNNSELKKDRATQRRCASIESFFKSYEVLKNIDAVILVSFRPFYTPYYKFRFDFLEIIAKKSPKADFFIIGNYFQLNRKKINSCLNLMFQTGKADSLICIQNSSFYNPVLEQEGLSNKRFDYSNIEYFYVSLFDLLNSSKGNYPYEYKKVPFMFDWNHLTKSFIELIALEIKRYSGETESVLRLQRYFD